MTIQKTPCQRNLSCRIPAERQSIQDKMSNIRSSWTEGQKRDQMLTELQQRLVKLGDACDHESHPDDWFEDPGVGYATEAYWRKNKAKYLCYYECHMRLECLQAGFRPENRDYGTYGGLHAEERQAVVEEAKKRRETPSARTDTAGVPTGSSEEAASAKGAQAPKDRA